MGWAIGKLDFYALPGVQTNKSTLDNYCTSIVQCLAAAESAPSFEQQNKAHNNMAKAMDLAKQGGDIGSIIQEE